MPNVYLVGMMGSGKTVTGKKLASLLGREFVDLDALVEEKSGRTIVNIFEKQGEEFFRGIESEALREPSDGPRVVATGGGIILRPENVRHMRNSGTVVYLETGAEALWQRVRGRSDRPLLKGADPKEKLAQILAARRSLYEQASDFRVATDGRTAEAVAEEIFKRLEKEL